MTIHRYGTAPNKGLIDARYGPLTVQAARRTQPNPTLSVRPDAENHA